MRLWFVIVCVVLLSVSSGAQATKYAGEFMTLGGGARALAMGSAFTAIADDATATYWNPAGIALLPSLEGSPKGWQAVFMHAEQFGDLINFNFFAATFPLKAGESAWGFTLIQLGSPNNRVIPLKSGMIGNSDGDDLFEPGQGEFINFNYLDFPLESVNDYAALFSYAQRFGFGQAGASVKLIRDDQLTGVTSFGIGLDLAFIRRDLWRNIGVGVKLQDATGTYIGWSTGKREFIYPTLKLGVAYPVRIAAMNSTVTVAADGDFRYENRQGASQLWLGRASADFHVGGELLIRNLVAVRGGWDMGRPTAGMGLLVQDISAWHLSLGLDYALLLDDKLDNTHRVSLMVSH
jgi:hypothetical protein